VCADGRAHTASTVCSAATVSHPPRPATLSPSLVRLWLPSCRRSPPPLWCQLRRMVLRTAWLPGCYQRVLFPTFPSTLPSIDRATRGASKRTSTLHHCHGGLAFLTQKTLAHVSDTVCHLFIHAAGKTSSERPEAFSSKPPRIPTPTPPTTSSPTSPRDSIPGTSTPPNSGLQAGPTGPNGTSDQRGTMEYTPRTAHGPPARPISKAQLQRGLRSIFTECKRAQTVISNVSICPETCPCPWARRPSAHPGWVWRCIGTSRGYLSRTAERRAHRRMCYV